MKMSNKPVVIIAHDAFQEPFHYQRLLVGFKRVGIENAIILSLPSSRAPIPAGAFAEDVNAIYDTVLEEITNGRDVVILAHGYAGMTVTEALDRMQGQFPATAPLLPTGKVLGLVFVAGVVSEAGESLTDTVNTLCVLEDWFESGDRSDSCYATGPEQTFYTTFPFSETLKRMPALVNRQAIDTFNMPVSRASWKEYQCLYVKCTQDNVVHVQEQDEMIERLEAVHGIDSAIGKPLTTVELDSDHWPMLSMADELTAGVEKFLDNARRSWKGEQIYVKLELELSMGGFITRTHSIL